MKKNVLIAVAIVLVLIGGIIFALNNNNSKSEKLAAGEIGVHPYFVKGKSKVVPVLRKVKVDSNLRTTYALLYLMEGVNDEEKEKGYSSEIPDSTRIISINESDSYYTVNFSKELTEGGGSSSMKTRLEQLVKTIENNADKPVYITIEDNKITTFGGEGLEISQPINPKK